MAEQHPDVALPSPATLRMRRYRGTFPSRYTKRTSTRSSAWGF